jgi:hypothetical protein
MCWTWPRTGPVARRVRDANLETREARSRLKPRGKPYWRSLERGLHLDYRRLRGKPRTWNVRHYLGDQRYEIKQIGIADDLSDADGVAILDIWQAQTAAAGKTIGPFTVADAYREYLEALKHGGTSSRSPRPMPHGVHYLTVAEDSAKQFLTDLLGVGPCRKRRRRGGCGS